MVTASRRHLILQGCLEVLIQAAQILEYLDENQYSFRPETSTKSSIGEHYRHILDLFMAVKSAEKSGCVDYDIRSRGSLIESDIKACLVCCEDLRLYFSGFDEALLFRPVDLKSEVTLFESHSATLQSSLAREIIFVSTHAVHHFAMIRESANAQGCNLPSDVGLAPATRTFLREQP